MPSFPIRRFVVLLVPCAFFASVVVGNREEAPLREFEAEAADEAADDDLVSLVQLLPTRANTSSMLIPDESVGQPPDLEPSVYGESTLVTAYLATMGLVGAAIIFIYYPQGASSIAGILMYVFALSTMKLTVKCVYEHHSLRYPHTLTALHFTCSSLTGFAVLLWRRVFNETPVVVPTAGEFFSRIVPIGVGFALSVALGNMALVIADAGFLEVISSTNPLISVACILVFGLPFDLRLLPPTCLVVAGCLFSATGVSNFSALGTMLVLGGNVCRSVKATLQQDLLPKGVATKFDPCSVLAWTSLVCVVVMGVWGAFSDGLAPLRDLRQSPTPVAASVAVGVSCMNACVLNLSMLFVVRSLGAVGTQIVGQTKAALTVFGSVTIFHEVVSCKEIGGFFLVLLGSYLFARAEAKGKADAESSKADAESAPEAPLAACESVRVPAAWKTTPMRGAACEPVCESACEPACEPVCKPAASVA